MHKKLDHKRVAAMTHCFHSLFITFYCLLDQYIQIILENISNVDKLTVVYFLFSSLLHCSKASEIDLPTFRLLFIFVTVALLKGIRD